MSKTSKFQNWQLEVKTLMYCELSQVKPSQIKDDLNYWKQQYDLGRTPREAVESLGGCQHKNIKSEDGCDECLDCGVRNY